jgi:hypothetical protein
VFPEPGSERSRTAMVSIRLSPAEQEQLRAEASEQGESLSQFIRNVVLRRNDAPHHVADVSLYPTSGTAVTGGLSLEAHDGELLPRTPRVYFTPTTPG